MATITLRFQVPRTNIPGVFALMEADNTPVCELRIKKPNAGVRETEAINADYFRAALGGGATNG